MRRYRIGPAGAGNTNSSGESGRIDSVPAMTAVASAASGPSLFISVKRLFAASISRSTEFFGRTFGAICQ